VLFQFLYVHLFGLLLVVLLEDTDNNNCNNHNIVVEKNLPLLAVGWGWVDIPPGGNLEDIDIDLDHSRVFVLY